MKIYPKFNIIRLIGELIITASVFVAFVFLLNSSFIISLAIVSGGSVSGLLLSGIGRIVELLESILHSINYSIENNKKSE